MSDPIELNSLPKDVLENELAPRIFPELPDGPVRRLKMALIAADKSVLKPGDWELYLHVRELALWDALDILNPFMGSVVEMSLIDYHRYFVKRIMMDISQCKTVEDARNFLKEGGIYTDHRGRPRGRMESLQQFNQLMDSLSKKAQDMKKSVSFDMAVLERVNHNTEKRVFRQRRFFHF